VGSAAQVSSRVAPLESIAGYPPSAVLSTSDPVADRRVDHRPLGKTPLAVWQPAATRSGGDDLFGGRVKLLREQRPALAVDEDARAGTH